MAQQLSQKDIDALLAAAAGEDGAPARVRRTSRIVRKMDFARPSKFNKDQLRTLQMLHESFCRRASTMLSGTIRTMVKMTVGGTEQIPYGDFVETIPEPTFTSVLEIAPLGTNAMASIDMPLLFALIDRLLGGPGTGKARIRELTDIEVGLASSLMDTLLVELTSAWSDLCRVEFRLRGVEMNAQFAQIAPTSEPSVLIVMEMSVGTASGCISLCLPFQSIEALVGDLTAQRYFAVGDTSAPSREQMVDGLRKVEMPVRVHVGSARLPVERVLALGPGDVIPLNRRVNDGMQVTVGNTRTYRAAPGRDGHNIAVRILAAIPPEENEP